MRSLIACAIGLTLVAISTKFSPALALITAIVAEGLGFDGMAVLKFLWS
jgi:hypothetical protein